MAEYSKEEVSTICGEIQKRIQGEMKDDEFLNFTKMITPPRINCGKCEGTGCFHDGKGLVVCRSCDYHRIRGRTLSVEEPESVKNPRSSR